MSGYKAVLFDAGGTLWRATKNTVQVWHDALSATGLDASLSRVEEAFPAVVERTAADWDAVETAGVPNRPEELRALFMRFDRELIAQLELRVDPDQFHAATRLVWESQSEVYIDTAAVLERLQGSYRMAIVSNGANQEQTARRLQIARYFDEIIGSLHVGLRKPMPEIFHLALSALGVKAEQAVMVGDNWEADVVGAEAAGIKALHIVRDGRPSPRPDAIEDLWGVVRFLEGG
jgi:putative hydrolase of the HAD superfamily